MALYTQTVMDHFMHPRNVGEIADADGVGEVGNAKGVTVKICGKEMVPAFADLMLTTGVRDGFVTRQPEYFANMLDNLGEHARLYMAFDPEGTPRARLPSTTATRSGISTARPATSTAI